VWNALNAAETIPIPAFTPKFAALLLGDGDAAVHLPVDMRTTFLWDSAAAAMLLVEAGGLFTSWSDLDFLSELPDQHTGGWLASTTPQLNHELRASLHQLLDTHGR
jgi:3'-phosphoadenosine 5'-phosphosulfate (PAPS) 3'-phosphatase